MPLALVSDFADVGSVSEQGIELAPRESRRRAVEEQALGDECIVQSVEGMIVVGIQLKGPANNRSVFWVDFNNAPTVSSDIPVSWDTGVWGHAGLSLELSQLVSSASADIR